MEIDVKLENYKDVQDFKKTMTLIYDNVVEETINTFSQKQVNILNQIDGYLKDISNQLKGTKMVSGSTWRFIGVMTDAYMNIDGGYFLNVRLASVSSGDRMQITIQNGDIIIQKPMSYNFENFENYILSQKQKYIENIIKDWKTLKEEINSCIMRDMKISQEDNERKLKKAIDRNSIYDNFEL